MSAARASERSALAARQDLRAGRDTEGSELDQLVAEYKHIANNNGQHRTKDLIWLLNELIYERDQRRGSSRAASR